MNAKKILIVGGCFVLIAAPSLAAEEAAADGPLPETPSLAAEAAPKSEDELSRQNEADDFKESWAELKNETVKTGRTAFKRGQAEIADLLIEAPAIDAKLDENILSIEPLKTELAGRSKELIGQAEGKKSPQTVATLEQEMALRDSMAKEFKLALGKDREDLAEFTKKMTDWQTKGPELDKQADELDGLADKTAEELKTLPGEDGAGEWYDLNVDKFEEANVRAAAYKEQSQVMTEALTSWKERLEAAKSRLIALKEAQGEWRLNMDRRTKEASESR